MNAFGKTLVTLGVAVAAGAAGWVWWQEQQTRLPEHIAAGNGRIEAEEVHVATKYAGRVAEVVADEGDMVEAGQVLARMDTDELDASLDKAEADIARAIACTAEALKRTA